MGGRLRRDVDGGGVRRLRVVEDRDPKPDWIAAVDAERRRSDAAGRVCHHHRSGNRPAGDSY